MITDIEKQSKELAEAIILLPEIGGERCPWSAYQQGQHLYFRRAIGSRTDMAALQTRVSDFNAASGTWRVYLDSIYDEAGKTVIMFQLIIPESVFDDFYQSLL